VTANDGSPKVATDLGRITIPILAGLAAVTLPTLLDIMLAIHKLDREYPLDHVISKTRDSASPIRNLSLGCRATCH
jgi:hypothetical protein